MVMSQRRLRVKVFAVVLIVSLKFEGEKPSLKL